MWGPSLPQQTALPANRKFSTTYTNHFVFPTTLDPTTFKVVYKVNIQQFYQFRDRYVSPALLSGTVRARPTKLSHDAVTALFLLRFHEGLTLRITAILFGVKMKSVQFYYNLVLDYVYEHSVFLTRGRNLGQGNNLVDLYEEIHNNTMNCSR